MPKELPRYNPETCRFVTDNGRRFVDGRELISWGILSAVLTCITFGAILYGFGSPSELWLAVSNDRMADRLLSIQTRMKQYAGQINRLSTRDRRLYRTLLQAKRIPDHALQMGMGGTLPPGSYDTGAGRRDSLVATTAQAADSIARKLTLQRESYRHLRDLVVQFKKRLPEKPAILPANGPVISDYGMRYHPIYRRSRMHAGIDIRTPTGTPVYATGAGRVLLAGRYGGYGLCVRIHHPATDHETRYAHLSSIPDTLTRGARVDRGDLIGYSGNTGLSTGPHLHYEVRDGDGESLNPVNFFVPEMTPKRYHTRQMARSFAAAGVDSLAG